jgi:PKD repeat protein
VFGADPLTVTFTDESAGPPINTWMWSFGDGLTSTIQHPTHIYTQTGLFSVSLFVTSDTESDNLSKTDLIFIADQIWIKYIPLILR